MSKISELSDGGSLVSTDYLIAVRSGGNVKVRMDQINVDQIDLGDNEFIRLGNSQDLTLVHNASNSIINQAGIGDLLIQKAGSTKLTVNSTGVDITGGVTATGIIEASDGTNGEIQLGLGTALTTGAGTYDSSVRWNGSSGNLLFSQGAVEKMRITTTGIDVTGTGKMDGLTVEASISSTVSSATGTVGRFINNSNSSDAAIVDIVGGNTSVTSGEAISALYLSDANANGRGRVQYSHQNDSLDLYSAAVPRLNIANNGDISFYEDTGTTPKFFWDASAERLGVGTITPNAPVDAQLSGSGGLPVSSGTAQTYGSLRVGATSFNTILDMGSAGASGAWLQASDKTALGTNYSLLLNPNGGNVGIGTAPDSNSKLHVLDDTSSLDDYVVHIESYTPAIVFHDISATATDFAIQADNSALMFRYGDASTGTQLASEAMRIDAQGQVRLSNTTPVWDTTFSTLVSKGGFFGSQSTSYVYSGQNAYYNGGFKFSTAANATIYEQSFGAHTWYRSTDVSPAADAAITLEAAMTLDASGNLLVGVTSPQYFSGVLAAQNFVTPTNGSWAAGFRNTTTTTPWGVAIDYTGANPNNTSSDFLYCSTSAGGLKFSVMSNGGIKNYQANDINLSDRREKTNFSPAKSYLDAICAIPVQTFNYIDQNMEDDPSVTLGVVAQDVQTVAPELVTESNWGTEEDPKMRLSIYQTDLQYALMKCIQEQQAIIEALEARIAALES